MINQIQYIFHFSSSKKYKLLYILSQVIKYILRIITGKLQSDYFIKPGKYIITNKFGTFAIEEPSDMHAILNHCFDSSIHKYFVLSPKKKIFLDIGANIGKYSIWMGIQGYQVFSFEPNQTTITYLEENIRINQLQKSVTVLPYGLSVKQQKIKLSHPSNNYGVASYKNEWKGDNVTSTEITLEPWSTFNQKYTIDIGAVGLIKIDIEGAEVDVLEGMKDFLQQIYDCTLIVKVNDTKEKVLDITQDAGFTLLYESSDRNLVFHKK